MKKPNTSWQSAHRWYDELVGEKGQHYHKTIILPKTIALLKLSKKSSLLDLGCGQGILSRSIPNDVFYTGIDLSAGLIQAAKSHAKQTMYHTFLTGDITKPL